VSERYDPTWSRRLVKWSAPWHHFEAKTPDPEEPSIGRLVPMLGLQLEAAMKQIDRLLSLLPVDQRLEELQRINRSRGHEVR
jgi:hypothetical protein